MKWTKKDWAKGACQQNNEKVFQKKNEPMDVH